MSVNQHHQQQERDVADLEDRNRRAGLELGSLVAQGKPTNRLYQDLERKFKKFVDNHPHKHLFNIPAPGPPEKYISKNSIETYFVEAQKIRVVCAGTIEKDIYALNLLAQRESSPLAPDIRKSEAAAVIKTVLEYVSTEKERKLKV